MPLLNDSTIFRKENLKRNRYSKNDEYHVSHKNALSDGDELGKGEKNGQIGNATDILTRQQLLAKNKFSRNKPYESVDEKPI